jgi:hypothetical protein
MFHRADAGALRLGRLGTAARPYQRGVFSKRGFQTAR